MSGNYVEQSGEEFLREPPRFKLTPFHELRPGNVLPYVVKDVIPARGLVLIWGPPKEGKTFWTFNLMMHVALGWPFRGHRVTAGPVVYCAFEGHEGFKRRAEAFRRKHNIPDSKPPFFLAAIQAKLVRDHLALIASIRAQTSNPIAIVLDTLNRSIDGSESKDEDMGAYLSAAEAVSNAFDCVIIIVHHCGVERGRPRGHTSQTGTCETQIAVRKDAASNVVAVIEFMKEGSSGEEFASRLEPIEVGIDQDGDPMTSCVVVPVTGTVAAPKSKKEAKWEKGLLRRILMNLGAKHGRDLRPIEGGPVVRAIDQEVVRPEFYASYRADGDAEIKQEARRKAFGRAIKEAQEEGRVGVREIEGITYLWLWLQPPDPSSYQPPARDACITPYKKAGEERSAPDWTAAGPPMEPDRPDISYRERDVRPVCPAPQDGLPDKKPQTEAGQSPDKRPGDMSGSMQADHGLPVGTRLKDGKRTAPSVGSLEALEWGRRPKSDDLPYRGPVVPVPDLGPDPLDEHGVPLAAPQPSAGHSGHSVHPAPGDDEPATRHIRDLGAEYRVAAERRRNGGADLSQQDQAALKAEFCRKLREAGVPPDQIDREFWRVVDEACRS
jgi:hypothetical protein